MCIYFSNKVWYLKDTNLVTSRIIILSIVIIILIWKNYILGVCNTLIILLKG